MHSHVRDEEHATGALVGPTLGHGVVYELEQALFDLTRAPGRHGARAQAQDFGFPRTKVSSTASSFTASVRSAFSWRSSSISCVRAPAVPVSTARTCSSTRPWRLCGA